MAKDGEDSKEQTLKIQLLLGPTETIGSLERVAIS